MPEITEEELQKLITEKVQEQVAAAVQRGRQEQLILDFGKQWFTEALSHTRAMVQRSEFPPEAHQVGELCFRQFLGNTGAAPAPAPAAEKPPE